tara:strand:- start:1060 stop:1638 length:579 start_codon:yes stop_codon:yes gene_type:complete
LKPQDKPHYVNNKIFSQAVVEYVIEVNKAQDKDIPPPQVPDYIAMSFLKISEGLSHKSNFIRYTYRDEMVMDGVENCLRAILNYNIEYATRTGLPNAFSYFTQICFYAFLRRLAKEKKQQDIKYKWIDNIDINDLVSYVDEVAALDISSEVSFVDQLKERISIVKDKDKQIKELIEVKINIEKGVELFMDQE